MGRGAHDADSRPSPLGRLAVLAVGLAAAIGLLALSTRRGGRGGATTGPSASGPDRPTAAAERVLVGYDVQDRRLGPAGCAAWQMVLSEDGRHLAWRAHTTPRVQSPDYAQYVLFDGSAGPRFGHIETYRRDGNAHFVLAVSADGKHVLYAGRDRARNLTAVLLDHEPIGRHPKIWPESLCFSPDSERTAYAYKRDGRWHMVVDGQAGPGYEIVRKGPSIFSPDSKRHAYCGRKGGQWVCVVDGKEQKPYEDVRSVVFSPDSRRVAYYALTGRSGRAKQYVVVVDGAERPAANGISGGFVFSPDGKRLAYALFRDHSNLSLVRAAVVLDGEQGRWFDYVNYLRFSPDGRRFAYMARVGTTYSIVLDGEATGWPGMGPCVFSPDSNRWAHVTRDGDTYRMVIDGQPGPAFDGVGGPVFSPDSRRVAHLARRGETWRMVVNGEEGPEFDFVQDIVFSPDSRHVACRARRKEEWFAVLDGRAGKPYAEIGDGGQFNPERRHGTPVSPGYVNLDGVVFARDGRTLAYKARKGDQYVMVVAGEDGPAYDKIVNDCPAVLPDGTLEYFAVKQEAVHCVRHVPRFGPPGGALAGPPVALAK